MKTRFCIWMLLCVALAGCTDNSYRGSFDLNGAYYQSSRLPVWIKIGEPTDLTKAGTEDPTGIAGRQFYVYAFNKDVTSSYRLTNSDNNLNTLIDGTIDDPASLGGRKAYWDREYERVVWANGLDVYWPQGDGTDYRYDFFAYYTNMELTADDFRREKDKVSLNIEIDGTQDLMSAKASTPEKTFVTLFPDEKERVFYQHYWCYSYEAAMMDIHPEFIFRRHLVKLNFRLASGVTPGSENRIKLNGLSTASKYKGEFVVAVRGESENVGLYFEDAKADFSLKEADGSALGNYEILTRDEATDAIVYKNMGGSLLVAPATSYKLNMQFAEQKDDSGEITPYTYSTTIYRGDKTANEMFEPGNEYLVTLTVFGKMNTEVEVTLKKWGSGGYVAPETEGKPTPHDED